MIRVLASPNWFDKESLKRSKANNLWSLNNLWFSVKTVLLTTNYLTINLKIKNKCKGRLKTSFGLSFQLVEISFFNLFQFNVIIFLSVNKSEGSLGFRLLSEACGLTCVRQMAKRKRHGCYSAEYIYISHRPSKNVHTRPSIIASEGCAACYCVGADVCWHFIWIKCISSLYLSTLSTYLHFVCHFFLPSFLCQPFIILFFIAYCTARGPHAEV